MDHSYSPMISVRENSPSSPFGSCWLFGPGGSGDGAGLNVSAMERSDLARAAVEASSCSWPDSHNDSQHELCEDISTSWTGWVEPDGGTSCSCFADQTAHLKSLYSLSRILAATHNCQGKQVEGRMSPRLFDHCRLDVCIQQINAALNSCRAFLLCSYCQKDTCPVLLAVSAFQLVIKLFERIVQEAQGFFRPESDHGPPKPPSPEGWNIPSRLGEYEVTREDALAIRKLIVQRSLQSGKETLELLRGLEGSHLKEVDSAYLRQVVCRCDEILELLLSVVIS